MLRATCCSNEILASSTPIGSIVSPPLSRARTVSCTRAIDDQQIRHARIERRPAGRCTHLASHVHKCSRPRAGYPPPVLRSRRNEGITRRRRCLAPSASGPCFPVNNAPGHAAARARRRTTTRGWNWIGSRIQQGPVVPRAEQSQSAPELRLQGQQGPLLHALMHSYAGRWPWYWYWYPHGHVVRGGMFGVWNVKPPRGGVRTRGVSSTVHEPVRPFAVPCR